MSEQTNVYSAKCQKQTHNALFFLNKNSILIVTGKFIKINIQYKWRAWLTIDVTIPSLQNENYVRTQNLQLH